MLPVGYLSTVMPSILAVFGWFHSKFLPRLLQMSLKSLRYLSLYITHYCPIDILGGRTITFSDGLMFFQAIMNFSPIVFGLIRYFVASLGYVRMHSRACSLAILDVATMEVLLFFQRLSFHVSRKQVLGAIMLKTREEKVRTISIGSEAAHEKRTKTRCA